MKGLALLSKEPYIYQTFGKITESVFEGVRYDAKNRSRAGLFRCILGILNRRVMEWQRNERIRQKNKKKS